MSNMNYKILVPSKNVVWKDDGNKFVLFVVDTQEESHIQTFHIYEEFIYTQLLDILLNTDYHDKNEKRIYDNIREAVMDVYDAGAADDLCKTLLSSLYVAESQTGKVIFNNFEKADAIIKWYKSNGGKLNLNIRKIDKKWLCVAVVGIVIGIMIGLFIPLVCSWFDNSHGERISVNRGNGNQTIVKDEASKHYLNAIYDPQKCMVYFSDTNFEQVDYFIDYQHKIKKIDDINWQLQSKSISIKDTLFLKDNCTVYVRGEGEKGFSEVHMIDVSYDDFITTLLVTQDPLIKSMLITNSLTSFSKTIFVVDGVPKPVSFYQSHELIDYIKKGYRVTSVKAISSNHDPTSKRYPRLSQITIQKQ